MPENKSDRNNESEEFRKYREQMHPEEYEDTEDPRPSPVSLGFNIFMILIYIGMGVLCLINYFGYSGSGWTIARYIVGIMLVVYGLWRAYRLATLYTRK